MKCLNDEIIVLGDVAENHTFLVQDERLRTWNLKQPTMYLTLQRNLLLS